MKANKLSLVALLAISSLLAFGTTATGQERKPEKPDAKPGLRQGGRGGGVQGQLDRMSAELKLSEEQKPKIKEILEENGRKQRELRDQNPTQEERREKTQALRKETLGKIEKVLTKEQFAKYQQMQEQGRQGRGQRQGQEQGQRKQRRQQ